jgi:uncharacterized protein YegJ (DUF2314 family)
MIFVPPSRKFLPPIALYCVLAFACGDVVGQEFEEKVYSYLNLGQIRYKIPARMDLSTAAPHFTNGPRLRKETADERFEISVYQSVTKLTSRDLSECIVASLAPQLSLATEASVDVKQFGVEDPVVFATLTQKGGERGKHVTLGYRPRGNALFAFSHYSDDSSGALRDRILALVYTADFVGAIPLYQSSPLDIQNDPERKTAVEVARSRLDEFFKAMESTRRGRSGFKIQIASGGEQRAGSVWLDTLQREGPLMSGIVIGQPQFTRHIRDNQQLFFTTKDVTDWGYRENGRLVGNFTVRATLGRLPKEEADRLKSEFGWD